MLKVKSKNHLGFFILDEGAGLKATKKGCVNLAFTKIFCNFAMKTPVSLAEAGHSNYMRRQFSIHGHKAIETDLQPQSKYFTTLRQGEEKICRQNFKR